MLASNYEKINFQGRDVLVDSPCFADLIDQIQAKLFNEGGGDDRAPRTGNGVQGALQSSDRKNSAFKVIRHCRRG